jgi:hypothetical protein
MAEPRTDKEVQNAVEGRAARGTDTKMPPGADRKPTPGPHAEPSLVNPDATPGTGALPPAGKHDGNDSTSG